MKRIVIAGGGYAGIMAANRLASSAEKEGYSLTLINGSDTFIERIREHQTGVGQQLPHVPVRSLLRPQVTFLKERIERIDPQTKVLQLASGFVPYDALIYAVGSQASRTGNHPNSYSIGAPGEADRFRRNLPVVTGSVVILGAGLTGIEMATELAEVRADLNITVVHAGNLDREFSKKGARHIRAFFHRGNIRLLEDLRAVELDGNTVGLADGTTLHADAVLQSAGFVGSPLARSSGLAVNERDQLLVDSTLRANGLDGVFGAGDAVALPEDYLHLRMGCVVAIPQGAHVAHNIQRYLSGGPLQRFTFGFPGQSISLGRSNGLIQFTDSFDRPIERVITGRPAAFIKEQVCRFTLRVLRLERTTGWKIYRWKQGQLQTVN